MARPIRVEFEGALYHVTARGNERRAIFRSDADRNLFLEALGQCAGEFGALVHAFCLMPNHYHLVLETPKANLSQTIGWLQTTYTIRFFNRRHQRSGNLFQGRFKAHLVEADSSAMELLRSIHLNPVRPRDKTVLIASDRWEALQSFAWSSHRAYAGLAEKPLWLCTDWLSFFDSRRSKARRQYLQFIRTGFEQVLEAPWEKLRGGLVLGSEEFWEKVKTLVAGKLTAQRRASLGTARASGRCGGEAGGGIAGADRRGTGKGVDSRTTGWGAEGGCGSQPGVSRWQWRAAGAQATRGEGRRRPETAEAT